MKSGISVDSRADHVELSLCAPALPCRVAPHPHSSPRKRGEGHAQGVVQPFHPSVYARRRGCSITPYPFPASGKKGRLQAAVQSLRLPLPACGERVGGEGQRSVCGEASPMRRKKEAAVRPRPPPVGEEPKDRKGGQ